jgi:hypothetical protein
LTGFIVAQDRFIWDGFFLNPVCFAHHVTLGLNWDISIFEAINQIGFVEPTHRLGSLYIAASNLLYFDRLLLIYHGDF